MRRAMEDRWYFTKEELNNTPSVRCGYSTDRELSCRQQAANFIQDMGQRLQVTQLCINTAIVYMHRFYMFHSFTQFHRTAISAAALFLAAKVEEQPRKLEHVIKVAYMCLHREQTQPLDTKSEQYLELAQDLVVNENVLLQTLGFDVAIDHPHTHVVQCCSLVKASKDLAQTSYFMASNSLHLTTMCLQYKPTLVACFCIHLAIKWSNWQIPESSEGRPWFWYVDQTVTQDALERLTEEFLVIFDKCPSRLKRKIMTMSGNLDVEKSKKVDGHLQSSSGMSQRPHGHAGIDDLKQKLQDPMTLAPRTQHNLKKLNPPSQHGHHAHSHSHGHGHHREQKSHGGHMQPGASSVPPKQKPNRPPAPDCMFPPPIRISEHNRQLKADQQQQQHYKQRMSGQHGSIQQPDMKQHQQSTFIPNLHHPPPTIPAPSVSSHSQKKHYEVPLPPPPPLPATPPPPPPLPTQPPPLPPSPSSRHQDGTISSSSSNNNSNNNSSSSICGNFSTNIIKQQEISEQSHRYDNSGNISTTVIKQEPNHGVYKQESMSMSSNRLNVEQNNHNRFIGDTMTNNKNNSSSNLYNVNIKQEPLSSSAMSSSSEQNHIPPHHSLSHHQSHHHSSHHRTFNDSVNYNNSGSSNSSNNYNNNVSLGGATNNSNIPMNVKQEQVHNVITEQQSHHNSRYSGSINSNDFIKKEPSMEQNNHYQQLNDNRNAAAETNVSIKKEPQSSSYSNTLSSNYDNSRLSSSSKQQQTQHNLKISTNLVAKSVKTPSIFSPEKDPLPISQNISNINLGLQHNIIQQQTTGSVVNSASSKLKRKRLSSSGSENEVMVPLVKKLQQDEIARYEDPNRSQSTRASKEKINSSQTIITNSMSTADWNIETSNINHDTIEQDIVVKPSASTNHSIDSVEVAAVCEVTDNNKEDRKRKEGREHKKKKKHKEHKEHKHKEKHKSKDRQKKESSSSSIKTASESVSIHIEPTNVIARTINSPASNMSSSMNERSSLKIKIPKDKIASAMPGLKVKFSKELLQGISKTSQDCSNPLSGSSSSTSHHRTLLKVSTNTTRHHHHHHDSSR